MTNPTGYIGGKPELVAKPGNAGSKPQRSESFEVLYNESTTGTAQGRCAHFYQESCLLLLAAFLFAIGLSLTIVAAVFSIKDLFILGPPMLVIGFVMFVVGVVYFVKKIKLKAKVAAACRREEEGKQFTSIHPPSFAPKKPLTNIPNAHAGTNVTDPPRQRRPTASDMYGNNNVSLKSSGKQEIIVEDLAHYEPPVGSGGKQSDDAALRVFFPNDGTNDEKDNFTYTTPLARLHESPEKKRNDSTSDIVPKLEQRDASKVSFASEAIVIPSPTPSSGNGITVPEPANYTPISLTKVEIDDYEKHAYSAVT